MNRVYVSLGSNLGDRLANLRLGLQGLKRLSAGSEVLVSSVYETAPWRGGDQPEYLNCVAAFDIGLEPVTLLAELKRLETAAGRLPDALRWSPRELDLDILLFGDHVVTDPNLTIPHPYLRERRFVLTPLTEIAGEVVIPSAGVSVAEALRECRDEGRVTLHRVQLI